MSDDVDAPRRGRDAEPEPSPGASAERAPDAPAGKAPGGADAAPAKAPPPSRVPRPLRFIVDDLGLKLLALVLAVSTWALVRNTQLHKVDSVADVTIELENVPPEVRILPGGTSRTKVMFAGTTGAVQRAKEQLEQSGKKIRLRVHDLTGPGGPTDFDSVDDLSFPFEGKQVVEKIDPAIRVRWTRVESLEVSEFEKPDVRLGEGYFEVAPGFPTVETQKVTVTGPVSLIARLRDHVESLVPDPVDAQAWLKLNPDLTTLHPWTSGFLGWRAADPENRSEALVTISPATVAGKLKVRETKAESMKADVSVLYPPGVAPSAYDDFEVKILDTGWDARARKLEISIKGDASQVTDRKSAKPGWTLVVALPPPPADGAPELDNVPADVRLVPPPDDLPTADAKPRLRLVGPTKVFVSIARRKP